MWSLIFSNLAEAYSKRKVTVHRHFFKLLVWNKFAVVPLVQTSHINKPSGQCSKLIGKDIDPGRHKKLGILF